MLPKYAHIARIAMVQGIKNYKAIVGLSLFLVTCLVIFAHLWKVAAAKAGAIDLPPDRLLWYIAFNEWVLVSLPEIYLEIEQDLRSGRLAYLLPRPVSYLGAKFAEGMGALLLNLAILGLVCFFFTWGWSGSLPFHTAGFTVAILLGILAGTVALLFQIAVGLTSFWLHQVGPFHWIWEKLLFVLGGLILPLATYPIWLQKIAFATPFPAIMGERSSLALTFDFTHVVTLLFTLAAWLLLGAGLVFLLYQRGLKILNISGG